MPTDLTPSSMRPKRREFVIVPRNPADKPDVPLRLPSHYCVDCNQRYVPCYACETTAGPGLVYNGPQLIPLSGVRDGLHLATCSEHGPISIACPHRSIAHKPIRAVAWIDPAARQPRQPQRPGPLDPDRHELMRERTAAAIGLLLGFIGGTCITLLVMAAYLRKLVIP